MTLAQFERNLRRVLAQAITAGREDPDRHAVLGGNAMMLFTELENRGGLECWLASQGGRRKRACRR